MTRFLPAPRRAAEAVRAVRGAAAPGPSGPSRGTGLDSVRSRYARELGWGPEVLGAGPGGTAVLLTGVRFDVLELPLTAGLALLAAEATPVTGEADGRAGRHRARDGDRDEDGNGDPSGRRRPYAAVLDGRLLRLLVPVGAAEELPALLEWLAWGELVPELRGIGAGGSVAAPAHPGRTRPGPGRGPGSREAANWLRPPVRGDEGERARSSHSDPGGPVRVGGIGDAPSLVRLVDAAAACCLGVRLRRSCQPLAFS